MFAELSLLPTAASTGELFRQVIPYALTGIFVIMGLHLVVSLVRGRGSYTRVKWNWWDMLLYLGTLGCVALLGVTSLMAVMREGALGGWMLFFHMFGAGAFTAVLPLLALSWAHANRLGRCPAEEGTPPTKFLWFSKLTFWLIIAGGLTVTMTMLISMLPIFGSDGLHMLLDVHRYSGLVVVVATALHFYSVVAQRVGLG